MTFIDPSETHVRKGNEESASEYNLQNLQEEGEFPSQCEERRDSRSGERSLKKKGKRKFHIIKERKQKIRRGIKRKDTT